MAFEKKSILYLVLVGLKKMIKINLMICIGKQKQ